MSYPPETTKDQFQRMFQHLLVERFKLIVHQETKLMPVYELVVAKNGPKLKESAEGADGESSTAWVWAMNRDGFPIIPAGQSGVHGWISAAGTGHWAGRQATTADVARILTGETAPGRRVIDKTGLTGKYDFTLYFGGVHFPGRPPGIEDDDNAPPIGLAVQQQLGLRLIDTKAPLEIVVVDHAEKVPVEN